LITGATSVAGSLKIRIRGTLARPSFLCSCEQITSHVRHPMQREGSGKMTPSESLVDRGPAPFAMPRPG